MRDKPMVKLAIKRLRRSLKCRGLLALQVGSYKLNELLSKLVNKVVIANQRIDRTSDLD